MCVYKEEEAGNARRAQPKWSQMRNARGAVLCSEIKAKRRGR